jgi:hypothetical protein
VDSYRIDTPILEVSTQKKNQKLNFFLIFPSDSTSNLAESTRMILPEPTSILGEKFKITVTTKPQIFEKQNHNDHSSNFRFQDIVFCKLPTIFSTAAISCIHNYPKSGVEQSDIDACVAVSPSSTSDILYKVSAAFELLIHDPKMKYMIGLNALFGFTASLLNSYVNGQVVPVALDDPDFKYVGFLSSWISAVPAGRAASTSSAKHDDVTGNTGHDEPTSTIIGIRPHAAKD